MIPHDKIYFISDLHLGAGYTNRSREIERHVVRFLDSIKESASRLYLVGDILDYWYEYRYVVPRGFVRFFGKLAELADSGVEITWLTGNHDIWIFDYLPNELGIRVVDGFVMDRMQGKMLYIAHGDRIGDAKWSFRMIQSLFRSKLCQWLFSGIHPRWTVPFAHRWSGSSRDVAAMGRVNEQCRNDALRRLTAICGSLKKRYPEVDYFIMGHYHILAKEPVESGAELVMLGDWLTQFTYAEMENGIIVTKIFPFQS